MESSRVDAVGHHEHTPLIDTAPDKAVAHIGGRHPDLVRQVVHRIDPCGGQAAVLPWLEDHKAAGRRPPKIWGPLVAHSDVRRAAPEPRLRLGLLTDRELETANST